MNLTDILKSEKNKKGKRVGRGMGSGKGKTSGRGHKGQKSRAGGNTRIGFEGGQMPLYRRLPKRGFTSPKKDNYEVVNVDALNIFEEKTTVGPLELWEKGLTRDKNAVVKVLGNGELNVSVVVKAHKFSKTAAEKIEAKEGKIEVIGI